MKRFLFLGSMAIVFIHSSYSQSYTIQGEIKDSLEQGIELATAILTFEKDSVMAGFSITNPKGKFKIDAIEKGDYILNVTFLGMSDISKHIRVEEDQDLGIITMKPASADLETITVTASHIPIQIIKDTIQYNADAYKTRPAANVEELLKKLPGVEVEDDGTITAHGETVENVLVDGKEFFSNDPTIATKNLPANVIDNVQVFDKRSDMAEFSGIDDGERQKTINLVLKEGKKAGYFGNAMAGVGNDNRYESKFTVNRFTKKTQLSGIGMLNNTNKQGFSYGEYREFMGGLGGMMRGRGNAAESGLPISNGGLGDGFVNTAAGGLNYNVEPSKHLEINSSYFHNRIENDIQRELNRENLLGRNNSFSTTESSAQQNVNKAHRINSKIEAKIDSSQKIITRITLGWNTGNSLDQGTSDNISQLGQILSGTNYLNQANGTQISGNINSNYLKRLSKPGRFFSTNIRFGTSNNDQDSELFSINQINQNEAIDTLDQDQILDNRQHDYLIKLSLTEPLGNRKFLEFNATRRNLKNDYRKDFFDITPFGRLLNDQFSNNYLRDYTYNTIGSSLKFNAQKSNLTIAGNLQHSALNGSLDDNEINIRQNYYYILPFLTWNFDLSATKNLRIRYRTNIREPSLNQLNPIPDLSNPLNFYAGNPDLRPSYSHRFNLNYNSYSQFSQIGFFSYWNVDYTKDNITNSQIIDNSLRQTTTPVNTDYLFSSSLFFNLTAPLKFIRQRINISNTISYIDRILFLNTFENNATQITNRVRLSMDNWKKDIVDLNVGTNINMNSISYSESSNRDQSYVNYTHFIDLNLYLKHDWNISTYFRHQVFSEEAYGDKIQISQWRASISKLFGLNKKYKLELSGFDLLNQNQNINRTTNANYIQDERIVSIGQFFMLGISYSFSGFGDGGGSSRGGRGRNNQRR